MQIVRLRLSGFKSFVEPAELWIEPGLTGVVGPNGCGKSNLLEALRWVMGEASHKSMRAASMDDVIFSGTTARPARDMAEVTIVLDNADRRAPEDWNAEDTIEITRRIAREEGSAYRINGREARARDVKILFEDAATGARSPALVRQGQISEIVNARPDQRRRVLEDAAGVAGLHSRRHEAELRLNAAEANLARVQDVLDQLGAQAESLKRQARAARRYKEVSEEVRKGEALLFHLLWSEAQARVDEEEAELTGILTRLAATMEEESRAQRAEADLAERLPPLREESARRAAHAALMRNTGADLDRQAAHAQERQRDLTARAAQLAAALDREAALFSEAETKRATLDTEVQSLTAMAAGEDAMKGVARETFGEAETLSREAEAAYHTWQRRAAEAEARRASLTTAQADCMGVLQRLEDRRALLATHISRIAATAPDAARLVEAEATNACCTGAARDLETQIATAEERTKVSAETARRSEDDSAKARLVLASVAAERATIVKLLAAPADTVAPCFGAPLVDRLQVAPGYEAALGAALGDDLDAPLALEAPLHWRLNVSSDADAELPSEAEPLAAYVSGPPEFQRRLRQIGLVKASCGARLQSALRPGQRLVTREGALWRWDGFAAMAGGQKPVAQRLVWRNQMADVAAKEAGVREAALAAAADAHAALERHKLAERAEQELRARWRVAEVEANRAQAAFALLERTMRETDMRHAAGLAAIADVAHDLTAAEGRRADCGAALKGLEDTASLESALTAARAEADRHRAHLAEARAKLGALTRDAEIRAARIAACLAERAQWIARAEDADQRRAALAAGQEETALALATFAALPREIAEKRQSLFGALTQAEEEHRAAIDALSQAETALKTAAQVLRAAEAASGEAREAKARIEARLDAARTRRQDEARRIRETLECAPEQCLALAGIASDAALPNAAEAERRLVRLKADRERLGGVNLDADAELTALTERVAGLAAEKADVEQAIAKLRAAIAQLNREGRARLNDAFVIVDEHFQHLFGVLFGGGEARLELIESEDPLEGGLEIVAKPPGKKPATLSLLSGGEQTLTALALIFAVFLTNPSPICVLDEVDAPLDDSNVDRFCTLMERMAADTDTRFLVITHHPMTMARMNRLFGVTMAEKGVSRLVSVDLEEAQSYQEA